MTTVFLAKKLLSMKFSMPLERIQYLKKHNMREIAKTQKSLQKLINKYGSLNSCRLCLRPAETNLFNNKAGVKFAEDIKNILNIEVRQNDGKPQYICADCITTLCKAVELKQVAEVNQWRLEQEAEILSESTCDDKADDGNTHDDQEITINHVNAPKRKHQKNDRQHCQEGAKKRRRVNIGHHPYVCETCGLRIKTITHLEAHLLTHTNEFNHLCGFCPYRARSRYSLQIHERRHTGVRPYRCLHCRATFTSASNFASHRRTHLPPTFKCDVCQKGFKFRQPLLDHISTQHRKAKPFFCCDCGDYFATRRNLRHHELKIHNRPKMRIGVTPSYIKSQADIDEELQHES